MLDFAPQPPKRWVLSRFVAVFRVQGQGLVVESLASGARASLDALDLALLRALASTRSLSAEELVAPLSQNAQPVSVDEASRRLDALAAMAVVFSQGSDPDIWWGIENGCRGTPFLDFVEITNHCPSRCIMCRAAQGFMDRPRGFMALDLFRRILAMIGPRLHQKPLILHNAGEPLLHPELTAMVSLANKADIPTEISTNAGLLTLDIYKALCQAGIARIIIALDGTNAKTLAAIRGPGARPEQALPNIDAILNHRAARPSVGPALVMQMVRMRPNAHQHGEFLERYGRLGLPRVSAFLKPLEVPAGSPLLPLGASPPRFFCTAPWRTLGIYWDGRVVPCCYDLNASLCLGNAKEQTLTDIWRGEALAGLRQRLRTDRCLPRELCQVCHHRPDRYQRPDCDTIPEIPDDWH